MEHGRRAASSGGHFMTDSRQLEQRRLGLKFCSHSNLPTVTSSRLRFRDHDIEDQRPTLTHVLQSCTVSSGRKINICVVRYVVDINWACQHYWDYYPISSMGSWSSTELWKLNYVTGYQDSSPNKAPGDTPYYVKNPARAWNSNRR